MLKSNESNSRNLLLCMSVINWRKAHFEETLMGFSLLEKSSIAPGVMKNEGDTTDTSLAKFFS